MKLIHSFILILLIGINPSPSHAQDQRISPLAISTALYKDSYIKITYSQPSKRGRSIFGDVVPYGQVWSTGANEATEITFTKDVIIQNTNIPAGTYSLFTIPNLATWTIILNKEVGLWGAYKYNQNLDIDRWEVLTVKMTDVLFESLTIKLDSKNNTTDLKICWDDICVVLPIKFNEPKK